MARKSINRPNAYSCLILLLLCIVWCPAVLFAQVDEDFSDGDFTSNPVWTGNDTLFTLVPDGADFALQSNGLAVSDTLQLRTANTLSHGTWSFRIGFREGQLTNFNQIRYFLFSDIEDLEGEVDGYHIQLGTNNRNVRLYRSDPGASGDRVLLGESQDQFIEGTEDTLSVQVSRDLDNNWFVSVEGQLLFTATESDGGATDAAYTGIWIKHSATRADDYFLDDILVTSTLPPDTFPPTVIDQFYDETVPGFVVDFSEPMDASSLQANGAFSISDIGAPSSVQATDLAGRPAGTGARLTLSETPPGGDYDISISLVTDAAGNAIADTTVSVNVEADTTAPFVASLTIQNAATLVVDYSEAVETSGACSTSNYSVSGGVGAPVSTTCGNDPISSAQLNFASDLEPGGYTLDISGVDDLSGNSMADTSVVFVVEAMGDTPQPGDIVVNEIFYDPPETDLEFVELYNNSQKTFDLSDFLFSDNRSDFETVSDVPVTLEPDAYAVLVRDAQLFTNAFPGVDFIAPSVWPALNNSGDAVILQFDGTTIDSVDFSPSWGGDNVTLERIDPDGPSNAFSNWESSIDPSGGTPGAQNSIFSPDTGAPDVDFAEQISANDLQLYFTEPIAGQDLQPSNFSLSGVQPETVIAADQNTTAVLNFSAGVNGDFLTIDVLTDLTGNSASDLLVEIARLPQPGDLAINEIMFDPRSNDDDGLADQPEYLELINTTPRLLALSGLFWTDFPDEDGEADTVRFVSNPSGIEGDNYAVVFAQSEALSQNEVYSNSILVEAFPIPFASLGVELVHFRASSLSLLNDGDRIRLHNPDGTTIDEVEYDPDWHHPNLRDAKGVALERIDPLAPSNSSTNWSSAVTLAGGTPGEQNSIFLSADAVTDEPGLNIEPSPFSPDRDGVDDVAAIGYVLDSAPSLIRVRVFDSSGRRVRVIEEAGLTAATGSVFWDGFDDYGNDLPVGIYVVLLEAIDSDNGNTESFKEPVVLARQLD